MAGDLHVQRLSGLWRCVIHPKWYKSSSSADFRLSLWLTVDISLALGCLHRVVAGNIADVSEVHVASVFTSYTRQHYLSWTSETSVVLSISTRGEHKKAERKSVKWFKHYYGGQWICVSLWNKENKLQTRWMRQSKCIHELGTLTSAFPVAFFR
jgi:hypothetical protein